MTFAHLSKPQRVAAPSPRSCQRKAAWGKKAAHSRVGFQRIPSPPYAAPIQAKLEIGEPNDRFEQEADLTVEAVMRMPDPRAASEVLSGTERSVQRLCTDCEEEMQRQPVEEEEELLQPKEIPGGGPQVAPGVGAQISALQGGGQPLPQSLRSFFEPRFGYDFAQVRIHSDARAGELARAVQARAFTVGRDVVFGKGEFEAATSEGKRLMAHELTHVVQQSAAQPLSSQTSAQRRSDEGQVRQSVSGCGSIRNPVQSSSLLIQRLVRPGNVSCRNTGLRNPNLTGAQAVAAIQAADAQAITLATRAERLLDFELALTRAGLPVDAAFDLILQQELGLTLTNPAHFPIIEQQVDRFRRVRELLESGFLRYICRGGTGTGSVNLVGCAADQCIAGDFAMTCRANRLMVLCQNFWTTPAQRPATILHEPFHILFTMARHAPNALRRADANCFESFALRLAPGGAAFFSCAGHTNG